MVLTLESWRELLHQYQRLKERAVQLFDGLRDLPAYGQIFWEGWFRRTFDAYNCLWKFQQEHRKLLEAHGGVRRHHVGETASRIGQLYYHFYLRTGDACYLDEAFTFYVFIQQRQYFAWDSQPAAVLGDDSREHSSSLSPPHIPNNTQGEVEEQEAVALAMRQLRFYARFAIVCFLLEKRSALHLVLVELRTLILQVAPQLSAHERAEWSLVLSEFDAFTSIDRPLVTLLQHIEIPEALDDQWQPRRRLWPDALRRQEAILYLSRRQLAPPLALTEAILVGACAAQPKVSELTIDVFRMLFAVEWDVDALKGDSTSTGSSSALSFAAGTPPADKSTWVHNTSSAELALAATRSCRPRSGALTNPHKYLLHRTTAPQLLQVLATALAEQKPNSALLLYLSADGLHAPAHEDPSVGATDTRPLSRQASSKLERQSSVPIPTNKDERGGGCAGSDTSSVGTCVASVASSSSSGRSSPTASLHDSCTSGCLAHSATHLQCFGQRASAHGDGVGCGCAVGMSGSGFSDGSSAFLALASSSSSSGGSGARGGGVAMAVPSASVAALRSCCLSPADLLPFARMPLFIVVDSDNAHAFASLPSLASAFSPPIVCLLAPCPASPFELVARNRTMLAGGGALTLFLHEPVAAVCALCEITPPSELSCGEVEAELADAYCAITSVLAESPNTAPATLAYLADPFLRMMTLRFAMCEASFQAFKPTKTLLACGQLLPPRCVPELPLEAMRAPALASLRRVAEALDALECFDFDGDT